MKHFNHDLLRHYFTEPMKRNFSSENSDVRTKKVSSSDPIIQSLQSEVMKLKFELKMFSLQLLQKSFKARYQIETIRGLSTKLLITEKQISNRAYLSTKSKLEIQNKLKNYKFTFNMLKGEYLQSA